MSSIDVKNILPARTRSGMRLHNEMMNLEKVVMPDIKNNREIYNWAMNALTHLCSIVRAYANKRLKTREFIVYFDETRETILKAFLSCGYNRAVIGDKVYSKLAEMKVYAAILKSVKVTN